jgi:D-alanine-D-alanine ligase
LRKQEVSFKMPPMAEKRPRRKRVLVLWNQVEEDVYEMMRAAGPQPLAWNPEETASEVGTVQEEMDAFIEGIRNAGYDVHLINLRDDIDKLAAAVTLYEPDVIFNLVEYLYDDETLEPNIAALYELYGLPYTGNPPATLYTCQRKVRAKLLLEDAGLPTSPYFVVEREPVPDPLELGLEYPLIVKPAREDASGGIEPSSVVTDYHALVERCRYLFKEFEQPALVEEYIEGREIHAAVLGNFLAGKDGKPGKRPEVLPLFEMEFDDSAFREEGDNEWRPQIISYSAKWDPHSKDFYTMDSVCPPEDLDPKVEARICDVALRAYRVLGCRDYARVDMRVDQDGEPYILEVNPNPDLADGSAFVMCSDASGRTYSQLLGEIIELALERAAQPATPDEHGKKPRPTDWMLRRYQQRLEQSPTTATCPKCGTHLSQASAGPAADADEPTPPAPGEQTVPK